MHVCEIAHTASNLKRLHYYRTAMLERKDVQLVFSSSHCDANTATDSESAGYKQNSGFLLSTLTRGLHLRMTGRIVYSPLIWQPGVPEHALRAESMSHIHTTDVYKNWLVRAISAVPQR